MFPSEVQEVAGCAWDVFLQEKMVGDGKKKNDRARCCDLALAFKDAIKANPPPPEAGHVGRASMRIAWGKAVTQFAAAYVMARLMDATVLKKRVPYGDKP